MVLQPRALREADVAADLVERMLEYTRPRGNAGMQRGKSAVFPAGPQRRWVDSDCFGAYRDFKGDPWRLMVLASKILKVW